MKPPVFYIPAGAELTQAYMQNGNGFYASWGMAGHTGIDYKAGFGSPVIAHNAGYVYKINRAKDNAENWQAVYILTQYGSDKYMEICYGHLSRIDVKEGDKVKAGQIIGLEGNLGKVTHMGQEITAAMQRAGDKRGSHVHCSFRPVRETTSYSKSNFYLMRYGVAYRRAGRYYEIINHSEATRGTIDPMQFETKQTQLEILKQQLLQLLAQIKLLPK